jgi:hypothetical protein
MNEWDGDQRMNIRAGYVAVRPRFEPNTFPMSDNRVNWECIPGEGRSWMKLSRGCITDRAGEVATGLESGSAR